MIPIRVQHRVGRSESLERLLGQVDQSVEVVTDDGEPLNPWRGYRLCLTDLPDDSHVAILQDDAIVCRNFSPVIEQIAVVNPTTPVALFMSKHPKRTHNAASLRYGKSRYVDVHLQDLVHVVAILWPVAKAREFIDWVDGNPNRLRGKEFQSDDATVTRWMQMTRQRVRSTVPSIVQHPDDLPSVVNPHKVSHGADANRVAGYWIGDADPLELDWSR